MHYITRQIFFLNAFFTVDFTARVIGVDRLRNNRGRFGYWPPEMPFTRDELIEDAGDTDEGDQNNSDIEIEAEFEQDIEMGAAVPPPVPAGMFQLRQPSQVPGQPSRPLAITGASSSQRLPFPPGNPSLMSVPRPAPGPIPRRTDGRVTKFLTPSDLAWDTEWPPRCLCQSLMAEQTSSTPRTLGQKFFVCPKPRQLRCDHGIWPKTGFHRRAPLRT